jgi:hypothetical protein
VKNILNNDQKTVILYNACRKCNLDAHIVSAEKVSELYTLAEIGIKKFGTNFKTPHKNSYLFCDSVDACFYITDHDFPCVNITAKLTAGSKDLTIERVEKALSTINELLNAIQAEIEKIKKSIRRMTDETNT